MNVTKLFEKMWTLHVKGKSFSLSTFFETLTFLAPMAGRKDASFSSPAPPLSRSWNAPVESMLQALKHQH
jgi:hypothetical protein